MVGKNEFRKTYATGVKESLPAKFRKSIAERMSVPLKSQKLERISQNCNSYYGK